ncbi:ABC transporter permease subunit [Halobacillus salinus]|uniref:ABC transporter permease subunit n=1 Tax=Halobacillus salinus TaxID=192814 RepID=UPI0009A58063|nr:ABC transporter permease subunit [Halobacillus salinus]
MRVLAFLFYYVLGIVGIALISTMPVLFQDGAFFNISLYLSELKRLFIMMVHPSDWVYFYKGHPEPIFGFLWRLYRYSMTLFLSGIVLGLTLAFFLALGTMYMPRWVKRMMERVLHLFEAIPDLLLAFGLQILIVWFYKQSGIIVMDFATVGQDRIYALPILTIAVLPTVMMYKVIMALMEEEMTKSYVDMAKSKGLVKSRILNIHMMRNIVKSMFYHSKIIVWGALSSLFIFEYIFNINGITWAFLSDFRPFVTAVILILLFTPFFFLYQGVETFVFRDDSMMSVPTVRMNHFLGSISLKGQGKSFKRVMKEFAAHFKNLKFLAGFLIIGTMLTVSFIHTFTADPLIEQTILIYDENGKLVSANPHSPEFVFLGTDELGFSIVDQLLVGAKYTILFALFVAFLRMIVGFILAIPFAFFFPPKLQRGVEKLVDGMHFLPLTIIAYIVLKPVLDFTPGMDDSTQWERILYEGTMLTLLVVPLVMILFGNEMKQFLKEEFVISTKVMGGSSVHLLWKHLLPHLSARMGIVFGQQFIQTLLLLIHLGVLDVFFGGTIIKPPDPPRSSTNEWSGLIGAAKNSLMTGNWWYIVPALVCFMVLIIAMQLIIAGIKEVQHIRVGVPIKRTSWWKGLLTKRKKEEQTSSSVREEEFEFIEEELARRRSG